MLCSSCSQMSSYRSAVPISPFALRVRQSSIAKIKEQHVIPDLSVASIAHCSSHFARMLAVAMPTIRVAWPISCSRFCKFSSSHPFPLSHPSLSATTPPPTGIPRAGSRYRRIRKRRAFDVDSNECAGVAVDGCHELYAGQKHRHIGALPFQDRWSSTSTPKPPISHWIWDVWSSLCPIRRC